jgi:transposase-like protein
MARSSSFEPVIAGETCASYRQYRRYDLVVVFPWDDAGEAHLREVYGVNASRELISNITDVVVDEIKAWQSRPLDERVPNPVCGRYPDSGQGQRGGQGAVTTKTAYLAIGVDVDARKHALGCWIQDTEGAKLAESSGGPA